MLGASLQQYVYPILHEVQQGIVRIYQWLQAVANAIFTTNGVLAPLKPLFVIGIAVSIIYVAILLIKKVVWGS